MVEPIHPTILYLHEVVGPRRIVEVDANGAQRVVEILETTGETVSDETCPPPLNTSNLIPFAASLRHLD
jgi:hypothetical protein